MTVRLVELFAGIGAQRMALMRAGIDHEVVGISEIDRHALASYEAIYGDCPNLGDIRQVESLPDCDLVTYSFPCQDLSLAGKREGMAEGSGTRSALVWEVTRVLEATERKPEWLLMENVPAVLASDQWGRLVGTLESMGCRNVWGKLDSSGFGSAQKRVRAFMVSRLGKVPPILPRPEPCACGPCLGDVMDRVREDRFVQRIPMSKVRWRKSAQEGSTPCAEIEGVIYYPGRVLYSSRGLAPTVMAYHSPSYRIKVVESNESPDSSQHPWEHARVQGGDLLVSALTPRECWRLMGFPDWAYDRAATVSSEPQLYNQAGNSIVVEVLMAIFSVLFGSSKAATQTTLEVSA